MWLSQGSPRQVLRVLGVIAMKTNVASLVGPSAIMIMELLQLWIGP
jgi:hypothetical protein